MIKAPIFLFLLALLLNLVESLDELLKNDPYSKLIGMVRKEIVDKALLYLPKREEINILQMFIQMTKAKEEYSLSEADSAYLAYKWIELNIKWEDSDNEDLGSIYNSGKGSPFGISTLFNTICSYLEVESGSIYGSYKFIEIGIYKNYNYTWNYVLINGSYYLIDAIMDNFLDYGESYIFHKDLFFGTNPEIFIRSHFPEKTKWQLLSEPYTREQFYSLAFLEPTFYIYGFKTISPDTYELSGSGKIIMTYNKSISDFEIYSIIVDEDLIDIEKNECNYGNGTAEIKFNINDERAAFLLIFVGPENVAQYSFVRYKIKSSKIKNFYSNLKRETLSILKIKNTNFITQNTLKRFEQKKIKNDKN